ncbi:hypothetical protein FHW74_002058 [Atlantibacter sp. RC6]|nr:hypothetical protein [Atlantibacter sp. RC6]
MNGQTCPAIHLNVLFFVFLSSLPALYSNWLLQSQGR